MPLRPEEQAKNTINKMEQIKNKKTKNYSLPYRWILFANNLKKQRKLTCELCLNSQDNARALVCHHIIPIRIIKNDPELIFDEKNIQVLCHDCHAQIHGDNRNWQLGKTQSEVMKVLSGIQKCIKH